MLVAMGAFHLKRLDFLNHILSRPEMDQQEEFKTFIDQAKGCFMTLPEISREEFFILYKYYTYNIVYNYIVIYLNNINIRDY